MESSVWSCRTETGQNLETEHRETSAGPPHFLPTRSTHANVPREGGASGVLRAQWWGG